MFAPIPSLPPVLLPTGAWYHEPIAENLNETQRNEEALRILQKGQEIEKGAPPIAQCTPKEQALIVLNQIKMLNMPIRSYNLFMSAITRGFKELVASLIKCPVNVNACYDNEETPLSNASGSEYAEIIEILQQAGAGSGAESTRTEEPTDKKVDQQAGQQALTRVPPKDPHPDFKLLHLLEDNCLGLVSRFLDLSDIISLDLSLCKGFVHKTHTIWLGHLHMICQREKGNPNIARHIVAADAKKVYRQMRQINKSLRYVRYLEFAVFEGHEQLTRALVKAGANVNQCNQAWKTLLMCTPTPAIATILIEARADIDAQDKEGRTALACAAMVGDLATVKLLIGARANPQLADHRKVSPLTHAQRKGKFPVAAFLSQHLAPLSVTEDVVSS